VTTVVVKKSYYQKIVDYIIKSRSASFCAKARDGRPRRSRGWELGEAQKDFLLFFGGFKDMKKT
jgi:hypothetical protein